MKRRVSALFVLQLACAPAFADCYEAAASKYQVSSSLLRAIAHVESGSRDAAVESKNKDGSKDIGRMQINTGWLPALSKFGIGERELRDECVSINVGAWIIAQNMQAKGLNWDAVGAYNVGCKSLAPAECVRRRNQYAWRVFAALRPNEKSTEVAAVDRKRQIGSITFDAVGDQSE